MSKKTILVVDDTPENVDIVKMVLSEDYKIKVALNGKRALKIANNSPQPDLILLDIMMPEMDGYEVCRRLKAADATRTIPIIFLTAKSEENDETKGFKMGAADYVIKPISVPILQARVKTQLALQEQNKYLEEQVKLRTDELNKTRLEIIRRLGRACEFKDNETGLHVIRMSYYSEFIGKAAGMSDNEAELMLNAAPMHDVGKIGIPDNILLKPGKLTEKEWELMRMHPQYGVNIIGGHESDLLAAAKEVALTHHEKWNGEGYPQRLKGKEIPLMGRIVAIADVFDALTTERPYKKAWSIDKAVEMIDSERGKHFDPDLVPYFIEVLPEILHIRKRYAEVIPSEPVKVELEFDKSGKEKGEKKLTVA